MTRTRPRLGAVILTGGTGKRLGGVDKAGLEVAGATLLEHALEATAAAEQVVVVGEQVATSRQVTWAREAPPGGGPAAGVLAGVDAFAVPPEVVCVLAVDMPGFRPRTLQRLLAALESSGAHAACLTDARGREQWLAGVYRYDALQAVRPREAGAGHGLAMRTLVRDLHRTGVPATADEAHDIDTWADLRRLDR